MKSFEVDVFTEWYNITENMSFLVYNFENVLFIDYFTHILEKEVQIRYYFCMPWLLSMKGSLL